MDSKNTVSDEISLVDIAKTLVIRRKWFLVFFLLSFLVILVFAYLKRPQQNAPEKIINYTTFLSVGWMTATVVMEPLTAIETELREIYIKEKKSKIPVDIIQDWVKMGNLMKIVTTVPASQDSEAYAKEVAEYHSSMLKPLLVRHENIYSAIVAETQKNKGTAVYTTRSRILTLAQRSDLNSAEAIPSNAIDSKFTSKRIILLGTIFSIVFGIVGVFFLEFILQVKKSLDEDVKG